MFKEQIREIVISDNVHASIINPIIQDLLGNTMENRVSKIDEILQNGTQVTFKANGVVRGIISTSGRSLEYEWNGTSLGVRQEGEVEYQFVDLKGEKGEKGEQGIQGIQGEKGDTGDGIHIDGLANSVEELPEGEPKGTCWLVGANLYYFNGTTWEDAGSIQGPQGQPGERGLDGIPGEKGDRGEKGEQGIQGPSGVSAINDNSTATNVVWSANKTNTEINNLKQSVSSGKTKIATAITGKGVSASGSDTHDVLATKINQIQTQSVLSGNAVAADVLAGKTFYSTNPVSRLTGSMVNRGAVTSTLISQNQAFNIPAGYHNGGGKVTVNIANLSAANIMAGKTIGGVSGTATNDGNAKADHIVSGKTAYVNGVKITGTGARINIYKGKTDYSYNTGGITKEGGSWVANEVIIGDLTRWHHTISSYRTNIRTNNKIDVTTMRLLCFEIVEVTDNQTTVGVSLKRATTFGWNRDTDAILKINTYKGMEPGIHTLDISNITGSYYVHFGAYPVYNTHDVTIKDIWLQ